MSKQLSIRDRDLSMRASSRRRALRWACWVFLGGALSACGFHLRNEITLPKGLSPVFVEAKTPAARALAQEVGLTLEEQGVPVAKGPAQAKLIVSLQHAQLDQRILTISAISGKQEETELLYQVDLEIKKADGTVLLEKQRLSLSRDFVFDETEVLAKSAEAGMLRGELLKDMLAEILRRLETVVAHGP